MEPDGAQHRITWESGNGTLYPDGRSSGTQTWNDYNVVRAREVPLFAGETITFDLTETSNTLDMGLALFRSTRATDCAGRSSAVASANATGGGGTEGLLYNTTPLFGTDTYGFVVFNKNTAGGLYRISVHNSSVADAGPAAPTPLVFAAAPNPFAGHAAIDFKLPAAG